MTTIQPIYSN